MPGDPEMIMKPGGPLVRPALQVPHRLCAIKGEPDYDPYWSPRIGGLWLDGEPAYNAVRFDVKEGWVEFYEFGPDGTTPIESNGRYVTRRRKGDVKIYVVMPGGIGYQASKRRQ